MYILTANQRKELDKFVKSIPSSTVKGAYERWSEKIATQNERVTTPDADEFVALSHNLDTDIQHFPQEFINNIKNYIEFNKEIPAAGVDKEQAPAKKEVAAKPSVAKKAIAPVKVVPRKKK